MKIKWLVLFLLLVGLGYTMVRAFGDALQGPEMCLFKRVTGWPCPSCGSTQAVVHLWHGHFWESILSNPLGIIVFVAAWPTLLVLLRDAVDGGERFEHMLDFIHRVLQSRPWLYFVLAACVAAIWCWKIYTFKHEFTGF